jgi:hypothetical protein
LASMVVSRRRASACYSCSWSPARASSARTARRPPLWEDMQEPWRAPAMNVGTTPAEARGIKKLDDGRRTPRLVYGLVYKGLGAIVRHTRLPRLSCKSGENKRADERTRTADLLITSEKKGGSRHCSGLLWLAKPACLSRFPFPGLHTIAEHCTPGDVEVMYIDVVAALELAPIGG